MNKLFSLLSVVSVVLLVPSCKEKPTPDPTPTGPTEITIQAATYPKTLEVNSRASWNPDGHGNNYVYYWGRNEEINIFYNGTSSRFVSQNTEKAVVAPFTGTLDLGGKNIGDGDVSLWGLYPYDPDASFDGQSVTTTIQDPQNGSSCLLLGTPHKQLFSKGENDVSVYFTDVLSYVTFSLSKGGIINRITFEGKDGEIIAGKINVAANSLNHPVINDVKEGKSLITVVPPNGESFEANKTYIISVIPVSIQGYTLTLYKNGQKIKLCGDIKKGDLDPAVYTHGGYDIPMIIVDALPIDSDAAIQFVDPTAKYACVAKFDANDDGEVSYGETYLITSIDNLFDGYENVKRFDEIKYFPNVSSLYLPGLKSLESITIPDFITDINFMMCIHLESIVIPTSISKIGDHCFDGCSSLTKIDLPSTITDIGTGAFQGCSKLTAINLPPLLTEIPNSAFSYCSKLSSITWPNSLKTIGSYAFEGCHFNTLELPGSITDIGSKAVSAKHLLVPSPSAVTISGGAFDGSEYIYVPANLVEKYKSSAYWNKYASIIHPLEDYPVSE